MKTRLHLRVSNTHEISSRLLYFATFLGFLLVAPQAFAQQSVDVASTTTSTPASGSTAYWGSTVTFTATAKNIGGKFGGVNVQNRADGVKQSIVLTNVPASLVESSFTVSSNPAAGYTYSRTSTTVTFAFADKSLSVGDANAGTATVSFTVPDGATTISGRASHTVAPDIDVNNANNTGTNLTISLAKPPAPVIQSFAPVRNALVAARNTSVAVTFSQPVTSISASNISIFSAQRGGLITAPASVSGNTATLKPDLFFKAGEVVSVTVPNTVLDPYGQATSNPQVYQFTTATTNGTGVFSSIADLIVGTNPSNQVLADLDGDNKLDLAVVNYANNVGNTVSVSRYTGGSGTPTLALREDFILGAGQTGVYNIAAGDFDGDGKIDLATANIVSNNVSVLRNTAVSGSINAASFAASLAFPVGDGPSGIAVGDIDGDGRLDIVTSNQRTTTVSVLMNTTVGSTISFATAQPFTVGSGPYGVAIGDIDNDGKLDLITANSGNATVSVLRNITSGTTSNFAPAQNFAVGNTPVVVSVGDLNNDGNLDIVTVNNGSNSVSTLRNTSGSNASFSFALRTSNVGAQPAGLALGDLDSDGKLDVAVSNYGSGSTTGNGTTASILLNQSTNAGAIVLVAQPVVAVGTGPNSVALGDLDGDGDLDLVTANQGGDNNTASIRINNTSKPPLPLPVSLIKFTAVAAGNKVRVSWSTATELNNAYFEVERSLDAATFVPVGRVAGSGTSSQSQQYSLLDNAVEGNVIYYRLRQVDLDATVHYSEVRMVNLHDAASLTLLPNPAPGAVSVDLTTVPRATFGYHVE